jgi:hypothetical protein
VNVVKPFLFLTVFLTITTPTATLAQDYGLGGIDSFISTSNNSVLMTNTIVGNTTFRSSLKKKLQSPQKSTAGKPTPSASGSIAKTSIAPLTSLQFKPSSVIRQKSKEQFFARMRKIDPTGAEQIEARYANRDLFQALNEALAVSGLRSDNVADAFTVWLINIWMGANGQTQDPPTTQIKAVRSQIATVLRQNPDLVAASDSTKQELAEGLLLNAAVVGAALGDPRAKSSEGKATLQTVMVKIGTDMGIDLQSLQLTNNGFEQGQI